MLCFRNTSASTLIGAALIYFAVPRPAALQKGLTVADYLEFEQVRDPQISPDGSRIAYTRRSVDKMKDDWEAALWIMDANGGNAGLVSSAFDRPAANGFVVLYTNPRGSTGYGEAFSQAIDHAYPSVDYLDLMAGVDATIAEGCSDEDPMYVGGCSGGGVLSSWVIGHTDRFAAAAVRCPLSNWLSMLGTTDIPGFTLSFFDRPFWEDSSDWLEHSSIM